jgi:hypothetical protein
MNLIISELALPEGVPIAIRKNKRNFKPSFKKRRRKRNKSTKIIKIIINN